MTPSSTQIVLHFTQVLDQLAIPYMLVGSFSSNFYGRPRQSEHADFVIDVADFPAAHFRDALGPVFQIDPQMSFESVTATTRWTVTHPATAFLVEIFQLSDDPHDRTRFARRRRQTLEGHSVVLLTAEDVIITKLRWSKGGNREKDIDDVREVLTIQADRLDLNYIRHWCDQHKTREPLERLLPEVKWSAPLDRENF